MAAGHGCIFHICGSSVSPVTPHIALRRKNEHVVLNHHRSFGIALNPQLPDIFLQRCQRKPLRSLSFFFFFPHLSSNIHCPSTPFYCRSSSAVLFSWCFSFSSRIPKAFSQSEHETAFRIASTAVYFTALWYSNDRSPEEVPPVCRDKNRELNASLQTPFKFFLFFPIKIQFPLRCKGNKRKMIKWYKREECATYN